MDTMELLLQRKFLNSNCYALIRKPLSTFVPGKFKKVCTTTYVVDALSKKNLVKLYA